MNRETFKNLFHDACTSFKHNECVKFIAESSTKIVTYIEMESMVAEISNCYKRMINEVNECIGIVCKDLEPEVVAIMMGTVQEQASFVFLDVLSKNTINAVERSDIQLFVCEETCIDSCATTLDTAIKDDLSSTKFFKRFRILKRSISPRNQSNSTEDIAFAAFSSGTTGSAKIIWIPFRCIIPNVIDLRNIYKLESLDTVYVSAPPTFDPCILDIFLALSTGCRLLFAAANVKFEEKIVSNIFSNIATVCYMTPSVFTNTFPKFMKNTSLRILTFGGEPFPNLDSTMYACLRDVNVYNIYGITEVSCWASINFVVNRRDSSLGIPLSDIIFEVRDQDGNAIEKGVGELFVGSYNRICIIEGDNYSGNTKPYFRASGDTVEMKDGKYFWVGRTDRRIKIFGHKVNLALIDAKLSLYPPVKRCHSIFIKEENIIVIFVVSFSEDITVENLESFLKLQFPSYAIPNRIFLIQKIPLNIHGKICEKTCKQLYHTLMNQHKSNVVREFEILWKKYTTKVSEDMGFIECGGNSILALQFTTALTNIGRVPNDFIVALLSNVKYSQCLELISQANMVEFVSESSDNHERNPDNVDNNEWKSRKKVKLELSFGRLQRVMGRGKIAIMVVDGNESRTTSAGLTESVKVKWKHDMTKCVDASPTVLVCEKKPVVVCGSHSGEILFVDVNNGDVLTQSVLPDRIESSACVSFCGKNIYLGCYDYKVYCINVQNGITEWAFATRDMVKSSPVYFDGKLYFGSYDHYFYCVSREGHLLWKTNLDESSVYASAVVENNIIVVTTLGGTIAFLEHGGRVKFRFYHGKPFFSSPCVIKNDLCVTIDVTGVIRLFSMTHGKQICQYQVDGNVFSSVSHFKIEDSKERDKVVFGCHDKRVYCFEVDEEGVNLCWRSDVHSPIYATPFCYGNGSSSLVCVATTLGSIYILNAMDGAIVKSYKVKGAVFSSPVVVGSTAILGCRDNYLYALDIS